MKLTEFVEYLRCPMTSKSLKVVDVRPEDGSRLVPARRKGRDVRPLSGEPTERMLVPECESFAYAILDGIPVLLGPERFLPAHRADACPAIDLRDPMYAEAYEEMEFYNQPDAFPPLRSIMGALAEHQDIGSIADSFPDPARFWIDSIHESLPQLEAYRYLAPVAGRTVLQIGGSGSHAVKMLLAGADRGFLITPMIAEARYAEWLARKFRVRDRFAPVLGIGEQIPFAEGCIDLVYSGGCFHHMRLQFVGAELHRVLAKGGKFSGTDPHKTFLHAVGTKLLGKREENVYCRPITPERLTEMKEWFPNMTASRHGPLLRYLFLGLEKVSGGRFRLPLPIMMELMHVDNFLGRMDSSSETMGGGALVMSGTKSMRSAQG